MKITLDRAATALLVVAVVVLCSFFAVTRADAVGPQATVISTATTSAAFSVTTSARVLATTTNPTGVPGITSFVRVYATICNPNANPVAINMDGDKAANSPTGAMTTWIAAAAGYNACYEITDRNQYTGSVTASSTNQTATTITVKDYVQ